MKMFYLLPVTISLLLCCQERKPNSDLVLEKTLGQFPRYHLLSLSDLDSWAAQNFIEDFPKEKPGLVKGDFDGDGHTDYAILLRSNFATSTRLVVLRYSEAQNYTISYEIEDVYTMSYITVVKTGSCIEETDATDVVNPLSPMILKYPGIRLTHSGKSERVIFWDERTNKFEEIWTAD